MPRSQLNFRCPPDLKKRFEEAAARHRVSLSEWSLNVLAAAATSRPHYHPEDLRALNEATEQLRRAGILLNQLLHRIHAYNTGAGRTLNLPEPAEWTAARDAVTTTLDDLRRRLGAL